MKLIADSGSTKTDWCILRQGRVVQTLQTQGLNPYHQSEETIAQVLKEEFQPVLRTALEPSQRSSSMVPDAPTRLPAAV